MDLGKGVAAEAWTLAEQEMGSGTEGRERTGTDLWPLGRCSPCSVETGDCGWALIGA